MKNLTQYNYSVQVAFYGYLQHKYGTDTLEMMLRAIEQQHRDNSDADEIAEEQQLWFKFSDDDTLVTTIHNLINDLQGTLRNRVFRTEQMQACIDLNAGINGTELQIYYG